MADDRFAVRTPFSPVLDAIRGPWRRWRRAPTAATRRTPDGKLYLGQGEPVMLFPMFGRGPESTARLRSVLDEAGFTTYDWGQGVDTGPCGFGLNHRLRALEEQVIDAFETERRPLTLVGWGLSGIYARELAKRTTPLVRQVITLGTPINTAAATPHACTMLRALQDKEGRMDPAVAQRLRQRPPVPCTSFFSVDDGAVPWQLCMDTESLMSENIRLPSISHDRLADHPRVLEVMTQRLARPEGPWRAFDA